jgi:hypothetical protein
LDFGNSNKKKTFFSSSMYPFACGVSISIVWTTTSTYLVESHLFCLLARNYNWTLKTWTLNVRLELRYWH